MPTSVEIPKKLLGLERDDDDRPIPFFVTWIEGEPDYLNVDPVKMAQGLQDHLCWICGKQLGHYSTFIGSPNIMILCCANATPAHIGCAEYSVQVCPHLMKGKKHELGDEIPVVATLWSSKELTLAYKDSGQPYFVTGNPDQVTHWCEGRPATQDEVLTELDIEVGQLMIQMEEHPDAEANIKALYDLAVEKYLPKD